MKTISFLIYFFITIFIVGNILLPLFYAIPRLLREKMSIRKPIISITINILILSLVYYIVVSFFENTEKIFFYAVVASSIGILFFSKKEDIEYDIQNTYLKGNKEEQKRNKFQRKMKLRHKHLENKKNHDELKDIFEKEGMPGVELKIAKNSIEEVAKENPKLANMSEKTKEEIANLIIKK